MQFHDIADSIEECNEEVTVTSDISWSGETIHSFQSLNVLFVGKQSWGEVQ